MDPLLGLLGTSVVAAIAGTAVKGIIRPLSWAVLAAALLLFGSSKVVDATNALLGEAQTSTPTATPNPTQTSVTNSAIASPAAAQGWQGATSSLNPVLSSLYNQGQPSNQGQTGQPSNTNPPFISDAGSSTANQNPAPPSRVSSQPSPPPVIGYW